MNGRQHGSAHTGLAEWLIQRLSALYMTGFTIYACVHLTLSPIRDYQHWKAWLSTGAVRIALILFLASLLLHAWVGLRSVFMDYLKPLWVRFAGQVLAGLGLLALAVWAVTILSPGARL